MIEKLTVQIEIKRSGAPHLDHIQYGGVHHVLAVCEDPRKSDRVVQSQTEHREGHVVHMETVQFADGHIAEHASASAKTKITQTMH